MDIVVNLDKPKGITSQDAVNRVKRILKVKKAGHAGALDPIATGVLLVCTGEATKLTRFFMDMEKEYLATIRFGQRTDTFDAEGKIIETVEDVTVERNDLERVLEKFTGTIRQTPPVYSALKVKGKPLYKLARKGVEVEVAEREVTIRELRVESFAFPSAELRVVCSRGTYIRSLCDDIGRALNTVAHMAELRRTRVGKFFSSDAALPEELPDKTVALHFPFEALDNLRALVIRGDDFPRTRNGHPLKASIYGRFRDGEYLRLSAPDGVFFAVGRAEEDAIFIERILHLEGKPQAKF